MKLHEILASNQEPLAEGLIKVPNDIMRALVHRVFTEYLSYMIVNELHTEDAKELAKELGITIDGQFRERNVFAPIETLLSGVSDKYKNAWRLEFGKLDFVIDWEGTIWGNRPKVNASFEEEEGFFTINPRAFKELVSGEEYSIEAVKKLFDKVKYSMWHEASHAVQHNALKWLDPHQVGKSRKFRDDPNSSKEDKRKEYLSSMVEYDPQIKTSIFKFRDFVKKYPDAPELKKLAAFVGAIQLEGAKPDEFFMALKTTDFKKWKKAVKYFYTYYGFDIDSLLKDVDVLNHQ